MAVNRTGLSLERLEQIYSEWNRREFISPDPLETLETYHRSADREIAGFLAAAMAYGRVSALLVPLRKVLTVMGGSPRDYVSERSGADIESDLTGIVHRFARPSHLAALLSGLGTAADRFGSLEAAFLRGYLPDGVSDGMAGNPVGGGAAPGDTIGGLVHLTGAIREGASGLPGHLLIDPSKGSACKRLLLFLRWMVRKDDVDPGGWEQVSPADLLLPLDTWTYRIALRAGWTSRRSADLKTVREVSAALAGLNSEDPVKYDFALSRFGIRSGLDLDILFGE